MEKLTVATLADVLSGRRDVVVSDAHLQHPTLVDGGEDRVAIAAARVIRALAAANPELVSELDAQLALEHDAQMREREAQTKAMAEALKGFFSSPWAQTPEGREASRLGR